MEAKSQMRLSRKVEYYSRRFRETLEEIQKGNALEPTSEPIWKLKLRAKRLRRKLVMYSRPILINPTTY